MLKGFIAGIVLLFPLVTSAGNDQTLKDRMISDIDVIRSAFEVGYAPRDWKGKYSGWDLDTEIAKAKDKVQQMASPSVKNYQFILRDFCNSMLDYHVGIYFFSTEKATLPFQVKGANGRYFFSYIDKERLSPSVFPVNVGDEIVSFEGKPVEAVIQDLMSRYLRGANLDTDRAFAEYFLTLRSARIGHVVPKGSITIGVRHSGSTKTSNYQLIWNYTPEKVTNGFISNLKSEKKKTLFEKNEFLSLKMVDPLYEGLFKFDGYSADDLPPPLIGYTKSCLPPLGRIWWQAPEESPFHAYIFETEDRKLIGYVRIPHYVGMNEDAELFGYIIRFFEERTDALVIDQLDNPGGILYYCYALASMLTDTPLSTPLHRIAISQRDVFDAVEIIPELEKITSDKEAQDILGESLFGLPVTYQMTRFFLDFFQFIVSEWNAGRKLTDPYFLGNLNHINPHPTARYTKPILMLVNSLDISCGDFFPAILQDNKRATLLGTRTAGAGGYVRAVSYPNRFGIDGFRYTGSIAERVDKNPIENLGVTPDIEYKITEQDLQYNFYGYSQAIHKALKEMLKR
ncbi:MAG: protease-like activity factor CPAF [Parachlamydia sp.]|nr:protease-like activity factor CPAF [Parachlamydia sp.]